MIPYRDDNPVSTVPVITLSLIVLNIVIYLLEVFSPQGQQEIVYYYGAIPHNLITLEKTQPIHPVATIFSSMFMHGGIFHLAGNMLYLWIFGNNIEDSLGHIRFLIFYLVSGVIAAYAHTMASPDSLIPMIGASGAVSGVLGAYLLLFPRAHVYTIIFFGFFWQTIKVPSVIVIGFWAIIQIINAIISRGLVDQGGVAWFAHIGGFVFGLITIRLWMTGRIASGRYSILL